MRIYIKGDIRCGVNGFKVMILMQDGSVTDTDGDIIGKAIELPPHGRLIDADALRAEHGLGEICENCPVDKRYCQYEMIYTKMEVCGWLDDALTIIPADPEKEDT